MGDQNTTTSHPNRRSGLARKLAPRLGLGALVLLGVAAYQFEKRANGWEVAVEGDAASPSLMLDIRNVPAGGRIAIRGKEYPCDKSCRIELSRRDVNAGQTETEVTLDWIGRRIRRTIKRELFSPLVKFEDKAFKQKLLCDIRVSAEVGQTHTYVGTEQGLTFYAKGAIGDKVTIGDRSPDEPGDGKYYSFSKDELLSMLTLVPVPDVIGRMPPAGMRLIKIAVPLTVQSSDGVGWKTVLLCDAEMLGGYLATELKESRISARASNTPKAGAFVVGDALFFVGEGASPWDARIIATVNSIQVGTKKCLYGLLGSSGAKSHEYLYRRFAHEIRAGELRTGAQTGAKRFTAMGDSCPETGVFLAGKSSDTADNVPSVEEEVAWFASLLTR